MFLIQYRWQLVKTSRVFLAKMGFLWKYVFDTILYKVSLVCTKILKQSTKMVEIEVANTQLLNCFETFFCGSSTFCLRKVLTRCHLYPLFVR